MLIHEYIKEFNKLAGSINFLSSSNEQVLKNKLLLIQTDIKNISSSNCNPFDTSKFYSNVYNILNQSSSSNSKLINSCLEMLTSSIRSRNKEIRKICHDINFMPVFCRLLVLTDDNDEEKIMKLLTLLKDSLVVSNELDEHSTKCLISSLCDYISHSSSENIVKMSLHVLSNLAMNNMSAKYLVRKTIKVTEVQKKICESDELVEMKFLATVIGDLMPKDFPRFIIMCLKSIKEGSSSYDIEPILHSLDFLKYSKDLNLGEYCVISENEQIMTMFSDLNDLLCKDMSNIVKNNSKHEFYDTLLDYYSELLTFDKNLVTCFESLSSGIFSNENYSRSSSALSYLSIYIKLGGKFSTIEKSVECLIDFYSDISDENCDYSYDQKYAFMKFISTLGWNEKLDNIHFEAILRLVEKMVARVKEYKIENINEQSIALFIYFLDALYALSKESNLFSDSLQQTLNLSILPCIIAKGFTIQNEDILNVLFNLTSMKEFPKAKVARLLASNHQRNFQNFTGRDSKQMSETSTNYSKYMNGQLYHELNTLIENISRKLDGNELGSLNASDIIALYRHKNSYLQAHLNTVNASLDKFVNEYNEAQQHNSILAKLGEKYEFMNWCLQLDKEKILKENRSLCNTNKQLITSVASFESKIEKEFAKTRQAQKALTLKTMEVNKLLAEKELMETERLKFKHAQKENENRIQQLKKELEQEKQLKLQEVTEAINEQKKFNEKRLAAERENEKLQQVIALSEKELMEKQNKINQLESELKEAEKVHASIMSIMQKSTRKN